ncbi:MAG: hypothetical protein M5U28_28185 [Sandaracinaceae bacterium]|nr:hypothetical protein [Sandaracinaceae bacterium]
MLTFLVVAMAPFGVRDTVFREGVLHPRRAHRVTKNLGVRFEMERLAGVLDRG